MNKLSIGFVALAAACTTALADGTGTVHTNPFSFGNGGEFTVTQNTGYVGETGMFSDFGGPGTFETFCVQLGEFFSPGATVYTMQISGATVAGGVPVDPRTAFLYTNFRNGNLAAYGFDYSPAGRQASAGLLQQAIWFAQGEGGSYNAFVFAAEVAIVNNLWSGVGDVRILNMYNPDGSNAQDMLTIVPTPGAAALMGLGLLAAPRRRRA
ncbi:MAG: hypothetical protein K2Q09_00375 [Phycisphaerales bacterium]|nr:hypothetical protein [Phycisphaerales bacterium]